MDREASTVLETVRRIALAVAAPAALLALTTAPAHAGTTVPGASRLGPATIGFLMDDVVARTNEVRVDAGCDPLAVEDELVVASVRQSHYMAATGDFGHIGWRGSTFETRSRAAGYDDVAAENIAWGFSSADEVIDAWMASPAHRENILNCDARSFGAGVQRAANGTLYWTQVFGWR
ncbi:CAP domain-containing protein [Actinoplanes sp. NPDC049681]|uniref:CAP domain-containing protein n=1 Tax=Actinoplanes sp. NPDC049681 TaxID=3363905 RepID=UPI00379E64A2